MGRSSRRQHLKAPLVEIIRNSALFDVVFYLSQNQDVRCSSVDPAEHYLLYGGAERRNPSAMFSTASYLAQNRDVAESGMNALLHYELRGRAEGRELVVFDEVEHPKSIFPVIQLNRSSIYYKSFMVSGLEGWYLEFGVYRGETFQTVYKTLKGIVDEFQYGRWDAGIGTDKENGRLAQIEFFDRMWSGMRLVAFDSFAGIPASVSEVDKFYEVFPAGSYACSEPEFLQNITNAGVDIKKVITVPGFFSDTLTPETAAHIGLQSISVAHIDSDLYSSAKKALEFCTPFFRDGSIVIFDEWFQFRGNPFLGERRAFSEWQAKNPSWSISDFATEGPWSKAFILSKRPDVNE